MDCSRVRDLLPEHALGTLEADQRVDVERHLAWCAGCRKEAGQLAEGTAAVALSLPPVAPPAGLEERVVASVAAPPGGSRTPRAPVVAAVMAALVAAASVAWAATMAGRIERLEDQAIVSNVVRFERVLRQLGGPAVRATELTGPGSQQGRALAYDGTSDWVLVVATGLTEEAGPYRAYLTSDGGRLEIGRMVAQSGGDLAVVRIFPAGVSTFDGVLIASADDRPVLEGNLHTD